MSVAQVVSIHVLSALLIGCSMATEEPPVQPTPRADSVSQVIVKFRSDQQINADIVQAMKSGPSPSASVDRFATRLSAQIGLPLEAKQITSGRELVLEVRRDPLLAELVEQLSAQPGVARCQSTTDAGSPPYRRNEVVVTFDSDSDAFKILQGLEPTKDAPPPEVVRVAQSLTHQISYRLRPRLLASGDLGLTIDTAALTQQVVAELQQRDDVDYAQPNYAIQHNN